MPFLPAASAEPRHRRGGAGGVRPRRPMRRSEQEIEVPERVYRGPHYSDLFKKIWCKGAALDVDGNEEHCNAAVTRLAEFADVSVRSVERALTEGRTPGPDGGPAEFTTTRKTHRGGRGRTAVREVRGIDRDEMFVTVPGWIAEAAEPRELAAVLLIAHAEKTGHSLTAAELAGELFHHHSESKGRPLSERTARRLIDRLEAKGFIDTGHRAGYQGRDVLTVRTAPLEPVPELPAEPAPEPLAAPEPAGTADNHGGSGPVSGGGSLAIKEYKPALTDGTTQVGGSFRRRRGDRKCPASPVDTASNSAGSGHPAAPPAPDVPAALRGRVRPSTPPAYGGPALTLSRDAWDVVGPVLTPVADLLPQVSAFVMRRIVREILRQVRDTGFLPEDIRDQVARMRAWTAEEDLTDPGRWLLGAVLPPASKCGRPGCHWGFLAHTGEPCKACAEVDAAARHRGRDAHPPHTAARPPHRAAWHECADCGRPSRQPIPGGRCRTCA
ncbi:hypothetical protein [Streptomyces sp. NPDC048386]|uniref:hypothetical protein n=1 Tax=Streptomyces sp. NPDC048386 TaxID=3365541 RepID=UPI00372215E0